MVWRSGNQELSLQVVGNWGTASVRVKQALKKAQGNIAEASRLLDVSERTLRRWMDAHPELWAEVDRLRAEAP